MKETTIADAKPVTPFQLFVWNKLRAAHSYFPKSLYPDLEYMVQALCLCVFDWISVIDQTESSSLEEALEDLQTRVSEKNRKVFYNVGTLFFTWIRTEGVYGLNPSAEMAEIERLSLFASVIDGGFEGVTDDLFMTQAILSACVGCSGLVVFRDGEKHKQQIESLSKLCDELKEEAKQRSANIKTKKPVNLNSLNTPSSGCLLVVLMLVGVPVSLFLLM